MPQTGLYFLVQATGGGGGAACSLRPPLARATPPPPDPQGQAPVHAMAFLPAEHRLLYVLPLVPQTGL